MWLGVEGWTLKAPNGKSIDLPKPMLRKGTHERGPAYKVTAFWSFVYKNGLDKDAKKFIDSQDQEQVEMLSKPKAERVRLEALREYSADVKKVLEDITDKKYQDVVKYWERYYNDLAKEFKDAQKAANKAGKSLHPYDFLSKSMRTPSGTPQYQFLGKAFTGVFNVEKRLEIYEEQSDRKKAAKDLATNIADEGRTGFIEKNTIKLSAIANKKANFKKATILRLNPDDYDYGGEISFEFNDGSSFVVRNKTVTKMSVNGKWFFQYPTTFHKVKMPDGKAMKSPSEKRMVDVFAGT